MNNVSLHVSLVPPPPNFGDIYFDEPNSRAYVLHVIDQGFTCTFVACSLHDGSGWSTPKATIEEATHNLIHIGPCDIQVKARPLRR